LASKATEDAVDAYLATNWTATPIFVENETASIPDDAGAFVRLQFPVSNVERVPVSDRTYRETGGFRIVIAVPRGTGTATIRDYGAQLADMFRDVTITGGVRCLAPSEPFTDDTSDQGLYFVGSLVVPFERYFSD
jgi:uncharacterized protein DUF4128